jgi:hypothetical protein
MKNLFLCKRGQVGKWMKAFCLCLFLVGVTSCKQGIEDELFSSGVSGVTLESPKLDDSNFVTLANSDGTESVKVTWSVVYGAGGYLLNVDIVDDPSNPIAVVADSIIDGCTVIFEKLEDTKYEVSVKSLGNEKLNNREAPSATVYPYSTLVPATTIPEGEDIAEFIKANIEDSDREQGFELLGGKTYQLNSVVDFGLNTITFRGDKANRPIVVLGSGGGLTTQGGLKLKFINFDCTAATQTGILSLSENPSESISTGALGYKDAGANQDGYVINEPVIIQECNFKNVKNSLLYGNKKNWSLRDLRIIDCIIQLNNSGSNSVIHLQGASNGLIKDLTIKNSTFYNIVKNSSAYFIRYSNASNAQPKKIFGSGDDSSTFTIEYNTLSHVISNKDFANNMPTVNTFTINIRYNILYDVYRLYQLLVNNTIKNTIGNTIYADGVTTWGGAPHNNDIGGSKDKNGNPYATLEDPEFEGPFEVELDLTAVNGGVNFTPHGPIATQNKSGDPRWYE